MTATELKKYIGNARLYLFLDSHRQPTFLQRNLHRVLEAHKRASEAPKLDWPASLEGSTSHLTWPFPKKEMLDLIHERGKPVLRVNVKGIRLNEASQSPDRSRCGARKRSKNGEVQCQVEIVIYQNLPDKNMDERHRDSHLATIVASRDEREGTRLSLNTETFFVDLYKLHGVVQRGPRWKLTVDVSYTIQISVLAMDMEGAMSLSELLEVDYDPAGADSPKGLRLSAIYKKLPKQCCRSLPLSRLIRKGEKQNLSAGLEVDIGFIASSETALQTYNRVLRTSRANALPSPPISEVRPLDYVYKTTWRVVVAGEIRERASSGCACVLCPHRHIASADELLFHLKTSHELFKIRYEKKEEEKDTSIVVKTVVELEVSDRYDEARARNSAPDVHEIDWIAPNRPFDMGGFLKGDEEWIKPGKKAAVHKTSVTQTRAVKPKLPAEVKDMPAVERRRLRVPAAPPGIRFFRTISKRPVEEGERLSESDDEVDEFWLRLKRTKTSNYTDLPEPVVAFMQRYDDFMLNERLIGDVHVGDALVRFTRVHTEWLRQPGIRQAFLQKIAELHSDKIISTPVFEFCTEVANAGLTTGHRSSVNNNLLPPSPESEDTGQLNQSLRRRGHDRNSRTTRSSSRSAGAVDADGDTEMIDDSQEVRTGEQLRGEEDELVDPWDPSISDRCSCGQRATDIRTMILCDNPDCERHAFHLACVQLDRRMAHWLCEDCRPAQEEEQPTEAGASN